MMSKVQPVKGDILLLERGSYGDDKAEYICVFGRQKSVKNVSGGYNRCNVAKEALRIGADKLFYDPDWNIFTFQDDDIVAKLNLATEKHTAFRKELEALYDTTLTAMTKLLPGKGEEVGRFVEGLYKGWLVDFLKSEYKAYREIVDPKED